MTDALPAILGGVIIGGLFVYAIEDRPAVALVLAAAALGGVLASAVRQAIGGKF